MNVLLVAPDLGLSEAANEVRQVSVALHAVVLNGMVTRSDLVNTLDALKEAKKWDVIWFATHGNPQGVRLSDSMISIADLTAIVRNSGAYLVVLNSCSSRYVGLELHYELGVDVITTETEVADFSAFQTGTLLARNLASGLSVMDAFERSRPGQQSMYYLFTRVQRDDETELRTIQMLNEAVASIKKMIMDGNQALANRDDQLEKRIDDKIAVESNRITDMGKTVFALEYIAKASPPAQVASRPPPSWHVLLILILSAIMMYLLVFNLMGGNFHAIGGITP